MQGGAHDDQEVTAAKVGVQVVSKGARQGLAKEDDIGLEERLAIVTLLAIRNLLQDQIMMKFATRFGQGQGGEPFQ